MIKSIESLDEKSNFRLNMSNEYFSQIYKVDSINLIIGENGSGKSMTIKSIINELVNDWPSFQFHIDGDISNLGIVYYTPVPFHSPIRTTNRNRKVSFIDASVARFKNQPFSIVLEEYLAASKMIDAAHELRSIRSFNFHRAAEKLAEVLSKNKKIAESVEGSNHYTEKINELKNIYRRIEKELNDYSDSRVHKETEGRFDSDIQKRKDELKQLSIEMRQSQRHFAGHIIKVSDTWSYGETHAEMWIAICVFIEQARNNEKTLLSLATTLATRRHNRTNFDESTEEKYNQILEAVRNLLHLTRWRDGDVLNETPHGVEWVMDISHMIDDIPLDVIERGNLLGLIDIDFGKVSSGQAAIYHQLINLSSAINKLADSGKRDFLIFIDEGDMLLHLEWQRNYLRIISDRLGNLRDRLELSSLQVVIATHSPLLASDALSGSITSMGKQDQIPALGAPMQKIVNLSFGTPSIGYLAEKAILKLKDKRHYDRIDLDFINQIDDEFIRHFLLSQANQ